MIKCKKCGITPNNNESDLDFHHIVPRGLGGTDKDGRIYLCGFNKGNNCHGKLHAYLTEKLREITYDWIKEECVKDDRDTGDIKTGLD